MNWYKWAQKKTLEQILDDLYFNDEISKETISWLKTLPKEQMGPAINVIMKNPRATMDDIMKVFKKEEPLTKEQEGLISFYPLIGDWMKGILLNLKGARREQAYNILKENAARIRDWIDRTRANLKGRTLENAIQETEKWHEEEAAVGKGEYMPTRNEDIIIQYPNGYNWQRISRGIDVRIEGRKMNHCVGSYCHDVENEKINVYSLRDKNNDPVITAGFKYNNAAVTQMKGNKDSNPVDTYRSYIKDILKKLGTRYNDGESYLNKSFGIKDLSALTEKDVEKDAVLRNLIHNSILRGDSLYDRFALLWAQDKLESGRAPQEWIDAINKKMASDGIPPNFTYEWTKNILDSGNAPQEWIDGIAKGLKLYGHISHVAESWMENLFNSGSIPSNILNAVYELIKQNGRIPGFANNWAKKQVESSNPPPEMIEAMNSLIAKTGEVQLYGDNWAKNILDSGNAPQQWIDGIYRHIEGMRHFPAFTVNWAINLIKSDDERLKKVIYKNIAMGFDFGIGLSNYIDNSKEKANQLRNTIDEYFLKEGSVGFESDIFKFIIDRMEYGWSLWISSSLTKWLEQQLSSGNAPEELIDRLNQLISNKGSVPNFARKWASTILNSGKAPDSWVKGIAKRFGRTGKNAGFASNWVMNKFKSGNIPEDLLHGLIDRINSFNGLPSYAEKWIKSALDSGSAPKELTDHLKNIIKSGYPVTPFIEDWAIKNELV
jgi:hypothetical protein